MIKNFRRIRQQLLTVVGGEESFIGHWRCEFHFRPDLQRTISTEMKYFVNPESDGKDVIKCCKKYAKKWSGVRMEFISATYCPTASYLMGSD